MIVPHYLVRLPLLNIAIDGFVSLAVSDDLKTRLIEAQKASAKAAQKAQALYAEWAATRKEPKTK